MIVCDAKTLYLCRSLVIRAAKVYSRWRVDRYFWSTKEFPINFFNLVFLESLDIISMYYYNSIDKENILDGILFRGK